MSFLCSIEKSTSGSLVSIIGPRQLLPFLNPLYKNDRRRHARPFPHGRNPKNEQRRACSERPAVQLDTWFIKSLVQAGHCTTHAQSRPCEIQFTERRPVLLHRSQRSRKGVYNSRGFFTQSPAASWGRHSDTTLQQIDKAHQNKRQELLSLVDTYDGDSLTDHLPLLQPVDLRQPPEYPKPGLIVSDDLADSDFPGKKYTWPSHGETKADVDALLQMLERKDADAEEVYKLYRALPAPRIPYIDPEPRHRLLERLAHVEHKNEISMLRYFSVLEDIHSQGIPLSKSEWTTAISFAGRYVAKVTDAEVQAGLQMWREMEHVAGVQGNHVTFNVLFDLAAKAGKFKLAEMIYTEMQKRGFYYNRYHYVTLIQFYGIKGDGTAVRQAYRQLVEAGEIVDTVVLNATISSLIRSGEAPSAELVYERMKQLHDEKTKGKLPPTDFRKKREIAKKLLSAVRFSRNNVGRRNRYQKYAIVAPDVQTFKILIGYHAIWGGDFDKVSQYLEEMKWFDIPVHGGIFLALFKGFALHGGVRYTHWTSKRLESVWNAYMVIVDREQGIYLGKWIIIWALRAFARCSGKEKVIDTWEECKGAWEPQNDELHMINEELHTLLETQPGTLHPQHTDHAKETY